MKKVSKKVVVKSKKTTVKPTTKTSKRVLKENGVDMEKIVLTLKEMRDAYKYVLATKGWERQLDDRLQAVKYALSVLEK